MVQLINQPTRMGAPLEFLARPKLEMIEQPLYSTIAFDAAALPQQVIAFRYTIGQQVPGAGAGAIGSATPFYTNMRTAGFLPAPTMFSIRGIRAVMNQLQWPSGPAPEVSNDTAVEAAAALTENDDLLDDIQAIFLGGSVFRLVVGPKNYAHVPLYMIPGNVGVGGIASAASSEEASAAVVAQMTRLTAVHSAGQYFKHTPYPITIGTQQTFHAEWTADIGTNITLLDARLLTFILDGASGREVL